MPTMAAADMPAGVYEGVGAAEHAPCADHDGECKAPEPDWWHAACADCDLETVSGPSLAYRSMGPSPRCPRRGEFHISYDELEKRAWAWLLHTSCGFSHFSSAIFIDLFLLLLSLHLFVLFPPFLTGCPLVYLCNATHLIYTSHLFLDIQHGKLIHV